MSDGTQWGSSDRYYAQRPTWEPGARRATVDQRWEAAMAIVEPEAEDTVGRAFKQWNNVLRDHLRNETGLRLTVGDDTRAVPVRIVPGLPPPLREVLDGYRDAEAFVLNRDTVQRAVDGCEFLGKNYTEVSRLEVPVRSFASVEEIQRVGSTASALLAAIDKAALRKKIALIQVDVFGCYYFRFPEIHLYWLAIAIFARTAGIDIAALTLVVLAHELAHAYTHLGADIDGTRWDTIAFASAHLDIVEGLAQFYTKVISEKLKTKNPSMLAAFSKLLEHQAGPYLAHKRWTESEPRFAGEVVRAAMIEARTRAVKEIDAFEKVVTRTRDHLIGIAADPGK